MPGLFSQARSLQVRGGVWEVCESSGFEGRCVTVSSDVANLECATSSGRCGRVPDRPRVRADYDSSVAFAVSCAETTAPTAMPQISTK